MISYHDVGLYEEDLQLLKGPFWLNDQIVAFYYEYLTHEAATSPVVCFLPGAASFFLRNGEMEDLKVGFVEPLKLKQREMIFMAVNDNPDVNQAEGGSHWSLLVWVRGQSTFVHLDSCGGLNDQVAKALMKKICAVLAVEATVKFLTPSVPQQHNSHDCALYMLKFTQVLTQDLTKWSAEQFQVLEGVTPEKISNFRKELLALVESKRQ